MEYAPNLEKARLIAGYINASPNLKEIAERAQLMLKQELPDLQTLAAACGFLAPSNILPDWHDQARLALTAPLQVALVQAQIDAQEKLGAATDKLSRRVLFATWVGVAVAAAGAVAAVAALLN